MINKFAILDINGCVIENNCNKEKGDYYILKPEHCIFLKGIGEAHKLLLDNGFAIIWLTCQDSIKEGLIKEATIVGMFEGMAGIIGAYCGNKQAITECSIIVNDFVGLDSDPKIQVMKAQNKANQILVLAKKYHIDLSNSISIGDRSSDIEAYSIAGIGSKYQILLPFGDKATDKADAYFESLLDCVKFHIGI